MQHFEVDYLFGQMEQGTGSGVAKITHESKKHKIVEGSWIVKAKEKGTVVKNSVLFKMFVLDGKHEELAKMYAASLYGGQPLEASASMEQSELVIARDRSTEHASRAYRSCLLEDWGPSFRG